jgi:uncharacterized protein (DUF58 family)
MRKKLRAKLRAWALRRQGADALPLQLRSRRLYIVPTRAGGVFAALIGVTFIAGMNYGNGLAMLLAFWLTGFALVAMLQTHRSLAGTRIVAASAPPAFVAGMIYLQIQLESKTAAEDLSARIDTDSVLGIAHPQRPDRTVITLAVSATQRGRWQAPPVCIGSRAPFGLFRTWTWLQLPAQSLVYPRAAGALPPPQAAGERVGNSIAAAGLDELAWLRPFREGDSPRQVAWKAYARGAPLLVREYRGSGAAHKLFNYESLTLEREARLSQLCRWVVDSAAAGERYTLQLPAAQVLNGEGAEHRDHCLRQLALFGEAS